MTVTKMSSSEIEERTSDLRLLETHDLDNVRTRKLQQKFLIRRWNGSYHVLFKEEWRDVPVVDGGLML